MKVLYDSRTDTLSVILKDNTPVSESDETKPGVILDYDDALPEPGIWSHWRVWMHPSVWTKPERSNFRRWSKRAYAELFQCQQIHDRR